MNLNEYKNQVLNSLKVFQSFIQIKNRIYIQLYAQP
jgi:hypothetical protein